MNHETKFHSAIYSGRLRHRRFIPKSHEFSYSISLFYLDLAELPYLFDKNIFASENRPNLAWFNRKDYFGDPGVSLDKAVRNFVTTEKGYCPQGPIRLLTQLRLFGFCFNPVSFYFIFEENQKNPAMILVEVNNTPWNQRHAYVLECDSQGKVKTDFNKEFHVSPFNPLMMSYHWVSTAPSEQLVIHMENHQASATGDSKHMDATMTLQRKVWSSSAVNHIIGLQPWAAIKVPLAIYWQAIKLFIKRVPFYSNPHTDTTVLDKNTLDRGVMK
jgi:uncharacterized protein